MDSISVTDLTDEELKGMLVKYGYKPGPIVKTTRSLYEKKLIKLLQGGDGEEQGDSERFSDPAPPSWSTPVRGSPKAARRDGGSPRTEPPAEQRASFENASFSPIKPSGKARAESDRMEGEEYYRRIPEKPTYASNMADYDEKDKTTDVRQRFSGTGSTPLYSKPVSLPGHSLRPWANKPLDPVQQSDVRTSSYSSTSSGRYGDTKFSSQPITSKISKDHQSAGGLPLWLKILLAFIVGVFLVMLARRFWMEMSDVDSPEKLQ